MMQRIINGFVLLVLCLFAKVAHGIIDMGIDIAPGQSLPVTVNADGNPFNIFIRASNFSDVDISQATVTIFYNSSLLGIPNLVSSPAGWNCNTTAATFSGIQCSKSSTILAGEAADFVIQVSGSNTDIFLQNAISATVSTFGDSVLFNNNVNIGVQFLTMVDLSVTKTIDGSDTLLPGDTVTFNVQVNNLDGNNPVSDVVVIDDLNVNGLVFDAANSSQECQSNGVVVECFTSFLGEQQSYDFTIAAQVGLGVADGVYTNSVTVSADQADNQNNNNFSSVNYTVNASANNSNDLKIIKTIVGSSQIELNDTVNYRITVENVGDTNISSVYITDTLPSELEFIQFDSLNGISCNYNNASATILCDISILDEGDSVEIDFSATAVSEGVVVNVAEVGSNVTGYIDETPVDNSSSANVTVINSSSFIDVELKKTASQSILSVNETFTYLLSVTNLGNTATSGNVVVEDILDSSLELVSIDAPGWTCQQANMVQCQLNGAIAANSSSDIKLNVVAPSVPVNNLLNTAQVIVDNDVNLNNNNDEVSISVVPGGNGNQVDLEINVTSSSERVQSGENLQWTLNAKNIGVVTATDVLIRNQLPSGFAVQNIEAGSNTICTLNNATVICRMNQLSPEEAQEIKIMGAVNLQQGRLTTQATIRSEQVDSDNSNNIGISNVVVVPSTQSQADMGISIESAVENIQQGSVIDLNIVTKNNGPDSADDVETNIGFGGLITELVTVNSGNYACTVNNLQVKCVYSGSYPVNEVNTIQLQVVTEQVVQQAENISVRATVVSSTLDGNISNNTDMKSTQVSATLNEEGILQLLNDAIGSSARSQTRRAVKNVASYCARRFFNALENLCDDIIKEASQGNGPLIRKLMREITPDEVIGQSSSAAEIVSSQFTNISSRLAELRGGAGSGISIAGLNARYGRQNIPVGMLAYLNQSEDEKQATGVADDFISPWGFFINGTFSMGERDQTGRELGFDFDTYGLTAGLDYRFNSKTVLGMALGYAKFDSEISTAARLDSQSYTLTGYGSFNITDRFYMDARISYGQPEFEQKRRVQFSIANKSFDRIATGKTQAGQYTLAMSAGYQFNQKAWSITPNASVRYVKTKIDSFTEKGAGDFNFVFSDQEIESLVVSAGLRVSRAFSLNNGVLTPQFDFNYNREMENDNDFIEAKFIMAPDDELFLIETDSPDRTYGYAGAGLVFVTANGKQLYVNYRETIGLNNFSQGSVNLGGRFEF